MPYILWKLHIYQPAALILKLYCILLLYFQFILIYYFLFLIERIETLSTNSPVDISIFIGYPFFLFDLSVLSIFLHGYFKELKSVSIFQKDKKGSIKGALKSITY